MCALQSMPGLAELTSPSFVSRSAAFAAVAYYTLAYATQLLPVQAAAGLVVTGLVSLACVGGWVMPALSPSSLELLWDIA